MKINIIFIVTFIFIFLNIINYSISQYTVKCFSDISCENILLSLNYNLNTCYKLFTLNDFGGGNSNELITGQSNFYLGIYYDYNCENLISDVQFYDYNTCYSINETIIDYFNVFYTCSSIMLQQ